MVLGTDGRKRRGERVAAAFFPPLGFLEGKNKETTCKPVLCTDVVTQRLGSEDVARIDRSFLPKQFRRRTAALLAAVDDRPVLGCWIPLHDCVGWTLNSQKAASEASVYEDSITPPQPIRLLSSSG